MLDAAVAFLLAPLHRLLDLGDPFSAASLAGTAIFAAVVMLRRRGRAPGRPGIAARLARLRALVRAGFSAHVWAHPSSRLDLKPFFVTSFFYATGVVELVVTSQAVETTVAGGLEGAFGRIDHAPAGLALVVAVTVLDFPIFELACWFAHWLLHRVPALWSFHALHHSAEVLTPMSEWRQHPIELFLIPAINAAMLGAFWGLTRFLFGPSAQPVSLIGFNAIQLVAVFTVLHLRHTRLWITVPGIWAKLLQTPAHHQIHHSADPRHFDKNLGLFLSLWDRVFGTLWIPRPEEARTLVLGIGEGAAHRGVVDAWMRPCVEAMRTFRPARPAAPPTTIAPTRLPAAE